METQASVNYQRIAQAIDYLQQHFRQQPGLEAIAAHIHLSPQHFQRLFSEWAGTSPKKFLQYLSVEHAKKLLADHTGGTLADAAYQTGLSSTSRLHELFISIEGMTPAEYKNGGRNLSVSYSFAPTPFGTVLIASTETGICHMAFETDEKQALARLQHKFPNAGFRMHRTAMQENALRIFRQPPGTDMLTGIKLHLKGTPFQLKVWESLLKIPMGHLSTYGSVAARAGNARASRAVGTAIGNNPIAFLIPCHRVIQSTGMLGGYMWGTGRKAAIIGWESAQIYRDS